MFLFTFAVISMASRSHGLDYCNVTCPHTPVPHTMCLFPEAVPPACADFKRGLTDEEKHLVLDLHNRLRQKVASGAEARGPPSAGAGDMMELAWDPEAETVAQRWADQCQTPDTQPHDLCRTSLDGTPMGQSIMKGGKPRMSRLEIIGDAISTFYDEVAIFPGPIDGFVFGKWWGHYTQLVWAKTTGVGCGFSDPPTEWTPEAVAPRGHYKLVCNYSPSGNYPGAALYREGPPCSACPEGTVCSQRYHGLCSY